MIIEHHLQLNNTRETHERKNQNKQKPDQITDKIHKYTGYEKEPIKENPRNASRIRSQHNQVRKKIQRGKTHKKKKVRLPEKGREECVQARKIDQSRKRYEEGQSQQREKEGKAGGFSFI